MKHANLSLIASALILAVIVLFSMMRSEPVHAQTDNAPTTQQARHRTFVIVHGAWGGGWEFRDVANRLTAMGNTVYRPTLTGQGEHVNLASPDVDLDTHITDICNVLRFEDLHDIILVGHSYGGMVITGVADRMPERVARLVYVDALLPEDGESVDRLLPATNPSDRKIVDGMILPTWKIAADPPHDVPQSAKTFSQPIVLKNAAARQIPGSYFLMVPPGKTIADARFKQFYERAQARGWPTQTYPSGHNMMLSHPEDLARMLNDVP